VHVRGAGRSGLTLVRASGKRLAGPQSAALTLTGWTPGSQAAQKEGLMKTVAILCNVVLAALTSMILATEGLPGRPVYLGFTLLMILAPVMAVFAMTRRPSGAGRGASMTAAAGNLVLVGFVCWAMVAQYPYPEGAGVVPYAVLALAAPVLSLAVLARSIGGPRARAAIS
jgi:hypothetical protein